MQATNMVLMNNAPLPGHVFKPTGTIFKLVRDIIGTHCFTNFHEDGTINVASRVLKSHIKKNAPPPGLLRAYGQYIALDHFLKYVTLNPDRQSDLNLADSNGS
ncbi:hypothetical protein DPMN_117790 [Dreissena polymorpha]|uniref:Uncharacterized protein n=1 Tax=Dreissena polymorpha TaxID=45954 RepID=A0A9D4JQJ3_DREPO|nr:hypothetical protein DPMN_117790 [Dreissena polymorpha]